jgi:hypothetical protein
MHQIAIARLPILCNPCFASKYIANEVNAELGNNRSQSYEFKKYNYNASQSVFQSRRKIFLLSKRTRKRVAL